MGNDLVGQRRVENPSAAKDLMNFLVPPVAYPDGVLVRTEQRTWFRWFTLACGIAGAGAGFLLAAGTAWLYPVKTGDKPIIAFYPTGIVTYELTMLFALAGTIIGMFLEMGLPSLRKRVYDPLIAEGYIGISVSIHSGGVAVACGADVSPRLFTINCAMCHGRSSAERGPVGKKLTPPPTRTRSRHGAGIVRLRYLQSHYLGLRPNATLPA